MGADAFHPLAAVAVGIGATLFMDLVALLLKRAFGVVLPSYCLVGRWICHMRQGKFTHAGIGNAPQRSHECIVGWTAHYAIGVFYAFILVALVSGAWLGRPTLLPALLFGICTVFVPFLIMQPSFGLGVAGSRTPNPMQVRLRSLMAHTVFGVGLYLCAVGVSRVLSIHA
jgi:hypothetical protein